MKNQYLILLALGLTTLSASAQTVNPPVTITPAGATGDDEITITVTVADQCAGTLGTEFVDGDDMYMHAGVGTVGDFNADDPGSRGEAWGYVVESMSGTVPNADAMFEDQGDGTYTLTMTPRDYFGVPAEMDITRLSMVFNNGTWDNKIEGQGKFDSGKWQYDWCGDIFVEFDAYKGVGTYAGTDSTYMNWASAVQDIAANTTNLSVFPNPSEGQVNLSYDLNASEEVKVEVLNTLGQSVATLFEGFQTEGSQSVNWNGEGISGKQVETGVYFLVIRAENTISSQKLVRK